MELSARRRATMVGPTANCTPSSMRATSIPAREIAVHSHGLQARPETCTGHGPVGAGGDSQVGILKLRRYRSEKAGSDTHVAVAHHDQIVGGFAKHPVQAVDLGVGIRRLAGDEDPARHARILLAQLLDHSDRRIVFLAGGEENLELRIVLLEIGSKIGLQIEIQTRQRFQDADGLPRNGCGRTDCKVSPRGDDRQQRVHQRPRQ